MQNTDNTEPQDKSNTTEGFNTDINTDNTAENTQTSAETSTVENTQTY